MASASPQILLTGATGFIGGTILSYLLNSPSSTLSNISITCLLRGQDRADTLSSTYGTRVRPVIYNDLDDLEATTAVAAQHDIVISTTLGFHLASSQALLRGLAQRKASTGRDVWMIHTSGTSNLADQPVSGTWVESIPEREFDDVKDDINSYEREREALHPYPQRTTELSVVDEGLKLGVKTVVMMPPLIYGCGTGLFNTRSVQVPIYINSALDHGRMVVLAEGKGVCDHVHVEDLAELYRIVLEEVLERDGKSLPTGKEGVIFGGNGRQTWMEVAQMVADACYDEGKITDRRVHSVGFAEGAKMLQMMGQVDETLLEVTLSSNARTVASRARSLGWKPTRGDEAWKEGIRDDVKAVLAKR